MRPYVLAGAATTWWGHGAGPWSAVTRHGIPALYLLAGALLFGLAARRARPQAAECADEATDGT
ncbi:hypothetical protein AB0O31_26010 [Kitasatospora cineracea]|uniref:hypothetical protein n=1 Tax=Kitasatospora cineracea TaxID=88074 RepID=UPI00341BF863